MVLRETQKTILKRRTTHFLEIVCNASHSIGSLSKLAKKFRVQKETLKKQLNHEDFYVDIWEEK